MASITKRLRRKYKGVKWIDTPWYRRQVAAHQLMFSATVSAPYMLGVAQIAAISQSDGTQVDKSIAIAKTVIATQQAALTAGKYVNDIFGMTGGNVSRGT